MATISASKQQEFIAALQKNGVQPTEQAIAQLIEIMKSDQRLSVATAAKRLSEQIGVTHEQSHVQNRASQGANIQSQSLDNAARGLATKMKKVLGAKAINYLMEDLAAGDLGEFFEESLDQAFGTFGAILDAEYSAIAGGEPSPLALPQSTTLEEAA